MSAATSACAAIGTASDSYPQREDDSHLGRCCRWSVRVILRMSFSRRPVRNSLLFPNLWVLLLFWHACGRKEGLMMAQQNAVRQWHLRRSGAGSGTELRRLRNMPGLTGNEAMPLSLS